jgi:hypothetical protein
VERQADGSFGRPAHPFVRFGIVPVIVSRRRHGHGNRTRGADAALRRAGCRSIPMGNRSYHDGRVCRAYVP